MDQFDQLRTSEKESTVDSNESVETLTGAKPDDEINVKTEQYVENIEHKVDELYSQLEKNTSSGWKSFSGFLTNFQKNIPEIVNQTKGKIEQLSISEEAVAKDEKNTLAKNGAKLDASKYLNLIKDSTTTYLDELDNDLQEVENIVGGFASKFGNFLKDAIAIDEDTNTNDDNEELDGDEAKMLFNVPDSKVFGTRAEQRLHQLNSSKELYLNEPLDKTAFQNFAKNFKIDNSQTEEALSNKELSALYNTIVPSEVTAEQFWLNFFYNKQLIEEEEATRKKLLSKTTPGEEEEEDKFEWDDDEDEDNGASQQQQQQQQQQRQQQQNPAGSKQPDSRTSSEVTYNLESANSSTLDIVASKKEKEGGNEDLKKNHDVSADEDDDDWE